MSISPLPRLPRVLEACGMDLPDIVEEALPEGVEGHARSARDRMAGSIDFGQTGPQL